MIVCVCKRVTDSQIKQAANMGVCELKQLREHCQVGVQCGRCSSHAKELLQEVRENKAA